VRKQIGRGRGKGRGETQVKKIKEKKRKRRRKRKLIRYRTGYLNEVPGPCKASREYSSFLSVDRRK
jgi:hypothetical protein